MYIIYMHTFESFLFFFFFGRLYHTVHALFHFLQTPCILFQISGPLLDESQVRCIVDELKQVITASSSRKRERSERAKAEDFDAEEGELLREENEQEEEVFEQVRLSKNIYEY